MDTSKHPCFNKEAKGTYGRVHIPIAPKCNIQCNFCNRSYDCVNESRPGVTSKVLKPRNANEYVKRMREKMRNLSVVGVAGPGDAFANTEELFETLEYIKNEDGDMLLCLSSNGLNVVPHIDQLKAYNVSHVTITVNGIDPEIVQEIVGWIRYKKRVFRGIEGAKILIEQQMAAIKTLKEKGFVVKVNSILIPGKNDHHIPAIAEKVAELGADMINIIPFIPVKGAAFEDIQAPPAKMISDVTRAAHKFIPLMTHCSRCRSDAAGLLGKDLPFINDMLKEVSQMSFDDHERPYVAASSREGFMVNQHLGQADFLHIYKFEDGVYKLHELRKAPPAGAGDSRWKELAKLLHDVDTLLVEGLGGSPYKYLTASGVKIIEMTGMIEEGLDAVFKKAELHSLSKKEMATCGNCNGAKSGTGCG